MFAIIRAVLARSPLAVTLYYVWRSRDESRPEV